MAILSIFVALQFADFATTLWFLERGVGEANPLVAALIGLSGHPAIALFLLKAAACAMAAYAWRSGRRRLLRRANIFFALCVAWNLLVLAGHSPAARSDGARASLAEPLRNMSCF